MANPLSGLVFKVQLDGSKPPIWRRVEIPPGLTLGDFHAVLQTAMGWSDGHLHGFEIVGARYGPPFDEDEGQIDETTVTVESVFPRKGSKGRYVYDYGDHWVHHLVYEGSSTAPVAHPRVTAGRGACPPEDCGGIWGYADLLATLADPDHPAHTEMLEWLGDDFDPAAFDLEETNRVFRGG